MTNWELIIFYAVCFIPIVIIFSVMPYIGRRTLSFGVSIPAHEFDNEKLVEIRKRFAVNVVIFGALMTAVYIALIFIVSAETASVIMTVILLLYLAIVYIMYVQKWRQVKEIKTQMGWDTAVRSATAADTRFNKSRRSVSAAWFILYALIIIATAIIGLALYDSMPDQIVQKTDFSGNVTKTVDKSIGVIFFAPAIQAVMALLFAFIYWMMLRTPPVLDPDNPEESSRQNAVFRYRWSVYVVFGGLIMLLIFFAMQLSFVQLIGLKASTWIPLIGAGVMVIGAIVLSVTTGQSGSRVRVSKMPDGKEIRRDDDRYWRKGMFYVNKDDPALFVEKTVRRRVYIEFRTPGCCCDNGRDTGRHPCFGIIIHIIGRMTQITYQCLRFLYEE